MTALSNVEKSNIFWILLPFGFKEETELMYPKFQIRGSYIENHDVDVRYLR